MGEPRFKLVSCMGTPSSSTTEQARLSEGRKRVRRRAMGPESTLRLSRGDGGLGEERREGGRIWMVWGLGNFGGVCF